MLKRCLAIPAMLSVSLILCTFGTSSWGVCPEDPADYGECDTIYLAPWPADTIQEGDGPYFVRVPFFVSNDLVSWEDSIAAFNVPLCITHSNSSKYCSVSAYWNTTSTLYLAPDFSTRSIFRHIVEGEDTVHYNRMADMAADLSGRDWDFRALKVESDSSWYVWNAERESLFVAPHFWMALVATGASDQFWWEGSGVLLATMTLKLEDTMQICLDTCFWPPAASLGFFDWWWGHDWVPRLGTSHDPSSYRVCFNVRRSGFVRGDANGDGVIDLADVVHLINFLYRNGVPPSPIEAGDADCDGMVDVADVVYLVNYLYRGGDPPGCP
jgi:hypothetical protein